MKVIHLTSVHQCQDARILHKECASLAKAGYEVSLAVKADSEEIIHGVKILPIKEERSRIKRFIYSARSVYRAAMNGNADVCHFHDPELIPVVVLLRLRGKKVIYDVHEDLPRQILSKPWISPWLRYPTALLASATEWFASRVFLSAVVAATPTIAKRFPAHKTMVVQNFPILTELEPPIFSSYYERPEHVVYVGGISKYRGVVENVIAFEHVQNQKCRFVLAGSFEDAQLEEKCRRLRGWKKVEFKGWLSRSGVSSELAQARAGLVVLHPLVNYLDSYPIKLFEYMSAGIPVIASDFPLWRKIVEEADCGLLVDPLNAEETAKAIDWLLENPERAEQMGTNGRQAVINHYNWQNEEKKLLELYRGLTQQ